MLVLTGTILFALSLGITCLALPPLERRAKARGLVDHPGGRKDHASPIPLVGGVAILLAVSVPALSGLFLALLGDTAVFSLPEELASHLPGIRSKAGDLLLILAGSAAMLLLGHLDDRKGLSPWTRLLVQVVCATILAASGIRITLFVPGDLPR